MRLRETSIETVIALIGGPAGPLLLAMGIELVLGDPVTRWHPVALFGRVISLLVAHAPSSSTRGQLAYGLALAGMPIGLLFLGSALMLQGLTSVSQAVALLAGSALLKVSFSMRQLVAEAARAAASLERDGVAAARAPLSALVSRDLEDLSPRLAASAAIESVAENLSDSVVAPLFYYAIFGVPGALAYRAINTLDAMIGYHGRYEYLGRAAARLDDIANLIPARLTAGLLLIAAWISGESPGVALAVGLRDHTRTESPNAGWPMAVAAGALGVQLEKSEHYQLGGPADDPTPDTIRRAVRLVLWAALLACALALAVCAGRSLG